MKHGIATHGCHPIPRSELERDLDGNIGTYGNKVAKLKVPGQAASLARNTFHQATVPKKCYSFGGSAEARACASVSPP